MDTPLTQRPRQRPLIFVLFTLLVFAGGVFAGVRYAHWNNASPPATTTEPVEPKVSARLYLPKKPPRVIAGDLVPSTTSETSETFESFRQTQSELVRTRMVLTAALRLPELASLPIVRSQADPIAWLAEVLQIDFPGTEIMRIGLRGDDTEGLRVVLDAVVGAYLERVVNREGTERAERLRRHREFAADINEKLKRQRETVAVLRGEGVTPDAVVQNLLDCRREIRRVRLALAAEAAPKEGVADAAHDKIVKQLEFLLREDKEIVAKSKMSAEAFMLDAEIEVLEQFRRQVQLQLLVLTIEQDSPPRVQLVEGATVRSWK